MRLLDGPGWFYDSALALLYPQACTECGSSVEARADGVACSTCWSNTRIFTGDETVCWKCGVESPGRVPLEKSKDVFCRRCDEYLFTSARACGIYEGALRASILALKQEPFVGTRLANLMFQTQLREPLCSATRIVPVPLHHSRERERGFNQAIELGRALASLSHLPIDEASLVRVVKTERHRAGMDARTRRESVEAAFEVKRPRLINGESILLIDDVFTTGATVSACAHALKEAGAINVMVLTIARPATQ